MLKRFMIATALAVLAVAGVGTAWEHHDVRAVACSDRPDAPC
jgi:high-affinity Fe2+/Pb2+ permease